MLRAFAPILQHRSKVARRFLTEQGKSSQSWGKEYLQNKPPQPGPAVQVNSLSLWPAPTHTPLLCHGTAPAGATTAQQLHHPLTPHWASFSLFFSLHRGRREAYSVLRGVSFVWQLFSVTNVFGCAISNSSVSGQASHVHQATCPIKLNTTTTAEKEALLRGRHWQRDWANEPLKQNWPCW